MWHELYWPGRSPIIRGTQWQNRKTKDRLVRIPVKYEKIVVFCQQWQITELALLGSVLRDDFRPDKVTRQKKRAVYIVLDQERTLRYGKASHPSNVSP